MGRVSPDLIWVFHVGINGVHLVHILAWLFGPFPFHITKWFKSKRNFLYQSVGILCLDSRAAFKWRACYFPVYLTPKLSSTRVNVMRKFLCDQSTKLFFAVWYPYDARCWTRASCEIWPSCRIPYIPLVNFAKIYPLCTLSCRLYAFMNFFGIMDVLILVYPAWSMQLLR